MSETSPQFWIPGRHARKALAAAKGVVNDGAYQVATYAADNPNAQMGPVYGLQTLFAEVGVNAVWHSIRRGFEVQGGSESARQCSSRAASSSTRRC